MTKEELLKVLAECNGDPEEAHIAADAALLTYIGDEEIAAAFAAIIKWYS